MILTGKSIGQVTCLTRRLVVGVFCWLHADDTQWNKVGVNGSYLHNIPRISGHIHVALRTTACPCPPLRMNSTPVRCTRTGSDTTLLSWFSCCSGDLKIVANTLSQNHLFLDYGIGDINRGITTWKEKYWMIIFKHSVQGHTFMIWNSLQCHGVNPSQRLLRIKLVIQPELEVTLESFIIRWNFDFRLSNQRKQPLTRLPCYNTLSITEILRKLLLKICYYNIESKQLFNCSLKAGHLDTPWLTPKAFCTKVLKKSLIAA